MFLKNIGELFPEVSHKLIEAPDKSVYYNHIHNHCELLLFIRGEADYNIDGQLFRPAPYDLLFIPAATYHYLIPSSSSTYENYVIGIRRDMISEKIYGKLFSAPLMISVKDDEELVGFFKRLDKYAETYSEGDFEKCATHLIEELIVYCSYRKNEQEQVNSGPLTHIEKIINYITDNIEKPLDAEMIAGHFMLSESYVQNMFSRDMHIGLKKYIMQKKIYSAHSDLEKGESATSVCEKYSFGDYSVFYRLYKKHFGVSPVRKNSIPQNGGKK